MRLAPTDTLTGALLDFSGSDDYPVVATGFVNGVTSPFTPGAVIEVAPTDQVLQAAGVPNWGACALMYVFNTGVAVPNGTLVTIDKNFEITAAASTGNTGIPLAVTLTNFSLGSSVRQGGWVMMSGTAPVRFSVASTVGALFLGTAGAATPTAAAGKQILNAQTLIAAATTFTRSVRTTNLSSSVQVGSVAGLFVGQTVAATGLAGTILSIDPSGTSFINSAAATASGSPVATFTPTGFGIVRFARPFVQGQIT